MNKMQFGYGCKKIQVGCGCIKNTSRLRLYQGNASRLRLYQGYASRLRFLRL